MSIQQINTDLLEKKKQQLENHKNNIMDSLIQVKDEYMKLINNDFWTGPRSDAFIESLRAYWRESYSGQGNGVIERIHLDFANMVTFISSAIAKTLDKDAKVAQDIGNEAGVSGTSTTLGNDNSTTTKPSTTTPNTTVPQTSAPATTQPQTTVPQTSAPTTTQPQTTMPQTSAPTTTQPQTTVPQTSAPTTTQPQTTVPQTSAPTTTQPISTSGTPRNVSVGGFYPEECNYENTYVAALNYKIIDQNGEPARDNIGKDTLAINGKEYEVYTYDDPETPEKESYIIGALVEDGEKSKPTGKVYSIDYGNGDVYEFVDLDTNYTKKRGSEKTPDAAMDTYVDILSVKGHAYTNIGVESKETVKILDTGKTVSKK